MSINVDMLKMREELEQERLSRFLEDKKNWASIAMILLGEASAITQGVPISFFVNLPVGIILYGMWMKWKNKDYIVEEMTGVIRQSLEYKECSLLYDKYLGILADFIRDLGPKSSKEVVLYFDALMNGGCLSQTFNDEYHNFKYDEITTTELLGARVVSGKCVCRHYASFAADLFNKLGIFSSPLMVKRECELNPEMALHNPRLKMDHAVVGIEDEMEKYLYDPTCSLFADKADIEFKDDRYSPYVAKPTGGEFEGHYLIYLGFKMYFNKKYKNTGAVLGALPMCRLDREELRELHDKVESTVMKRIDDVSDFVHENKSLVTEIARLEGIISPHSDEPIKKWVLTR